MSNVRIVLVLMIATEFLVVWWGAWCAFTRVSKMTSKRTVIGMLVGVAMGLYGLSRLLAVWTNIKYGAELSRCLSSTQETRSLVQVAIQVTSMWMFALTFAGNADKPSWVRRQVNTLAAKLQ